MSRWLIWTSIAAFTFAVIYSCLDFSMPPDEPTLTPSQPNAGQIADQPRNSATHPDQPRTDPTKQQPLTKHQWRHSHIRDRTSHPHESHVDKHSPNVTPQGEKRSDHIDTARRQDAPTAPDTNKQRIAKPSIGRSIAFSIVIFTTLGFSDMTPVTHTGRLIVAIEVIVGYVLLGALVSILSNKLARRS